MDRARVLAVPGPIQDAPPTPLSALSGDTARKIEIFISKNFFYCFDVSALHTLRAVESVALGLQSRQEVRRAMCQIRNVYCITKFKLCVKLTYVLNVILRNGILKMSI